MAGNFTATRPYIYITGNLIDPAQNNANEGTIYTQHNGAFNAVTGHEHTGAIGDGPPLGPGSLNLAANYAWTGNHSFSAPGTFTLNNGGTFNGTIAGNPSFSGAPTFVNNIVWSSGVAFTGTLDHANTANRVYTFPDESGTVLLNSSTGSGGTVPIGSVIPWQDYGILTFDPVYWQYCDGSAIASGPLNGQSTQDMSGRYLVGFGTDGGGNIDTAPWAVGAVGNAGNQINIAHTHDMGNHTHSGPSHIHAGGSLIFQTFEVVAGGTGTQLNGWDATGSATQLFSEYDQSAGVGAGDTFKYPGGNPGIGVTYWTRDGGTAGFTAASGTGATGTPSTNTTSSSLSATQSIQPISIRVRYIIRIL